MDDALKDRYLFKGKREDNGEWITGSLVVYPCGTHKIFWQPFKECTTNTYHKVVATTVCQCTGFKDRDGTRIFEGDKLQMTENIVDTITWALGCFCLAEAVMHYELTYGLPDDVKVLGNVHD